MVRKLISFIQDIDIKGVRRLSTVLPKILIRKPSGATVINSNYGFKIEVDPINDSGLEEQLYYTGTYEKGTLWVLEKVLRKGDIVVDIGANIGLITLFASIKVGTTGKVFGFEPQPNTHEIYKRNIALNNFNNITASSYALGNSTGKQTIYNGTDQVRGNASLVRPENNGISYDIEITSLNDFFGDNAPKIDLIKLDIEGFELEALKGASDFLKGSNPPMLIVECSSQRSNFNQTSGNDLFDFIKSFDLYKIYKLKKGKGRKSDLKEILQANDLPDHDNIFCFSPSYLDRIQSLID